ncbi:hypothetical protein B0H67DRAFT_129687 [Lasiosphaeris hirsuta]|uniref:Uncharacterized protein n=1 Tax=Lasiosphaeris hirsuta TaxID=260670 RepID=A0AA40B0E3_9PEZI|nr:hypothetical protein B0H67DRAFT_129687 [Lasiosphaeris hirsuta]
MAPMTPMAPWTGVAVWLGGGVVPWQLLIDSLSLPLLFIPPFALVSAGRLRRNHIVHPPSTLRSVSPSDNLQIATAISRAQSSSVGGGKNGGFSSPMSPGHLCCPHLTYLPMGIGRRQSVSTRNGNKTGATATTTRISYDTDQPPSCVALALHLPFALQCAHPPTKGGQGEGEKEKIPSLYPSAAADATSWQTMYVLYTIRASEPTKRHVQGRPPIAQPSNHACQSEPEKTRKRPGDISYMR